MTETNEKDLKLASCPFCNSADVDYEASDQNWKYAIRCNGCKTRGPLYRTMPEALSGWNTRAVTTALAELVKAVKDERKMCECETPCQECLRKRGVLNVALTKAEAFIGGKDGDK